MLFIPDNCYSESQFGRNRVAVISVFLHLNAAPHGMAVMMLERCVINFVSLDTKEVRNLQNGGLDANGQVPRCFPTVSAIPVVIALKISTRMKKCLF